ncbi:ABC transporter permease [Streptomyces sp. NPDC021093]|uniref:ABC transporter permease n=1 Tax=Streptomyces sp. NPDC021093 TaxID=3365112 RepID=UPI00379D4086
MSTRIPGRALRSPVLLSVVGALVVGTVFLVGTGSDPLTAYGAILGGAFGADGIGSTLASATSVIGLAVALAIPLRAGLLNLGGEGQLVLGGITAAVVGLYSPLPAPLTVLLCLLAGMGVGAAYAALAAVCQNRFGVPLLISSLLLSYPAVSLASYLARYPLKDPASGLPQTRQLPDGVALPEFGTSTVTLGLLLVLAVAVAHFFVDARTATGYEIRMSGLNSRFASYAGIDRPRLTVRLLAVSGAVAGLVGAVGVLGFPYRFTDGALTSAGDTWTGLMAALLASAAPVGTVLAALFFAALKVGGLNMERVTEVPSELTGILQAIVIVFLAARFTLKRRGATVPTPAPAPAEKKESV